jgi:hypothetical protein
VVACAIQAPVALCPEVIHVAVDAHAEGLTEWSTRMMMVDEEVVVEVGARQLLVGRVQ